MVEASSSSSPDELYTLRAQFALGHFRAALQEANQVARRPMSPHLKIEREEYVRRAQMALSQYDLCAASPGDGPGLQALSLQAQYLKGVSLNATEESQRAIVDALKSLAATTSASATAVGAAVHVCLDAGDTAAAYAMVATSTEPELVAAKIQILLKIDRLDLARQEWSLLSRVAEESVWTELSQVYVHLATGASMAGEAEHAINSLTEQYGPSILLTNLLAVALASQGDVTAAEAKLLECVRDASDDGVSQHETLVNLVAVQTQLGKTAEAQATMGQLLQAPVPTSCSKQFVANLERVTTAFDREAAKYKV